MRHTMIIFIKRIRRKDFWGRKLKWSAVTEYKNNETKKWGNIMIQRNCLKIKSISLTTEQHFVMYWEKLANISAFVPILWFKFSASDQSGTINMLQKYYWQSSLIHICHCMDSHTRRKHAPGAYTGSKFVPDFKRLSLKHCIHHDFTTATEQGYSTILQHISKWCKAVQ
jgi:hypothetical protein